MVITLFLGPHPRDEFVDNDVHSKYQMTASHLRNRY